MQDIMNKNSYYKIKLSLYRFNQEEKKERRGFKEGVFDFLYDLLDAIKSSALFFLLMSIMFLLSILFLSLDKNAIILAMMIAPFFYLFFMNICIQRRQRENIVRELGEEYRDLFFSQENYSQDFLLKKIIRFRKFIYAEKLSFTSEEIDSSIQYIKESNRYTGFKLPEILSKIQTFGLLGICFAALLQKDSITIQNLFSFLEILVYCYTFIFICLFLYDVLFKKPIRDFCFILITYKELYCKN